MKNDQLQSELARPLSIDKIPAGGMVERIVASPFERAALAKRFGLPDVLRLEADLNIDHADNKMIAVTGSLDAEIVQTCVLTLESFRTRVADDIDTLFAPPSFFEDITHESHVDGTDPNELEPIQNGIIDLGELVSQHLALALDPYPRKPGVVWGQLDAAPESAGSTGTVKPFASLAELIEKRKRDGRDRRGGKDRRGEKD
jgi:uncharacterized metal-binding protein YceD (DUF177 family)